MQNIHPIRDCCDVIEILHLPLAEDVRHIVMEKRIDYIERTCAVFLSKMPDMIVRSVPARQYEFVLGRLAASTLLGEFGLPIGKRFIDSKHRRPLWPSQFVGSISHSKNLVAVSVCNKASGIESIGIDIEILLQETAAMNALMGCFSPAERAFLEQADSGLIVGFSMKEALYKCLNPIVGIFFDFLDIEIIQVNTTLQCMDMLLKRNLSLQFPSGVVIRGSYRLFKGHVWTIVSVNRD